uniref:Uncharacterized protein n=1 Tax=Anguilla anguilla TaxID=7936 RepID=A0A0E9QPV2_ANGAN
MFRQTAILHQCISQMSSNRLQNNLTIKLIILSKVY